MFDKLKQLGQFKAFQDEAKNQKFEASKQGVKVIVNGNLVIEEIILNNALSAEEQAQTVKDCVNDAIRNAQVGLAEKLKNLNLGF